MSRLISVGGEPRHEPVAIVAQGRQPAATLAGIDDGNRSAGADESDVRLRVACGRELTADGPSLGLTILRARTLLDESSFGESPDGRTPRSEHSCAQPA